MLFHRPSLTPPSIPFYLIFFPCRLHILPHFSCLHIVHLHPLFFLTFSAFTFICMFCLFLPCLLSGFFSYYFDYLFPLFASFSSVPIIHLSQAPLLALPFPPVCCCFLLPFIVCLSVSLAPHFSLSSLLYLLFFFASLHVFPLLSHTRCLFRLVS